MPNNSGSMCSRLVRAWLLGLAIFTSDVKAASEIDKLLALPLEKLEQVTYSVASLSPESELVTASTVSKVTEQDWQQAAARRTNDAIGHLPATLVSPAIFGGDAISIRGFTQSLSSRGMATLIDGVPVNNFALGTAQYGPVNFGLGALNNIEMIRGPGSAIYGSDAFHGVLAMNTFQSNRDSTAANIELASNNYFQSSFRNSSQLSDSWRANIALTASGEGDQNRRYSYADAITGDKAHGTRDMRYESQSGAVKLISDATQTWSYHWGLYWDNYNADEFPGFGRGLSGNKSALGSMDWDGNNSRFTMTTLGANRNLPNQITAQVEGFAWHNNLDWPYTSPVMPTNVTNNKQDVTTSRRGASITLKQADNAWHTQWISALGYDHMRVDSAELTRYLPDGSLLSDTDEAFGGLTRNIQYLFAQARTRWFDEKLQLVYGGRIDSYSDLGTQHTPRLGIILLPQPDLAFKLLYGQAFRAPAAIEIAGSSTIKTNSNLKPELIDSYEFKVMKQTPSWTAELTLFESQWKNGIITVASSDPRFSREFANVGKNKSQGAELAYHLANAQWLADVSASYVRSQNQSAEVDYGAFPRIIFNAGFGYQLSNGIRLYLNNRINYLADEGPTTTTNPAPARLPTYWRTDLNAIRNLTERCQLSINVRNFFNRDNFLPSIVNAEKGVPDEPLSVSIGLGYKL